jgi:glucose/arabinose dehydrogenase
VTRLVAVLTAVLAGLTLASAAPSDMGSQGGSDSGIGAPKLELSGSTEPSNTVLQGRAAPGIKVPAGYRAEIFATGLKRPTALAWGPDGLLYATQEGGEVVAVGRGSSRPRVVASGFRTPLGIAFDEDRAFVSAQGTLWRLRLSGRRLVDRRALVRRLPFGRHQQDNVVVAPDGRLYFGSGSTCDVCREKDRRSATVLSVRQDGTDLRIEARGLRNPYGLALGPGGIYVSVNNQDELGTWEPAESIVKLRRGARYGWPTCWPSWRERRLKGACRGVTRPVAYLEPHSAAAGMAFWRGRLYVAEWGQYLSEQFGRKVVAVNVATGRATTFADGFEHPLAVVVDTRGDALLVADHGRGTIVRIVRTTP